MQYDLDEIPLQGRVSGGVINMKLKNGGFVISSFASSMLEFECLILSNKGIKKIVIVDIPNATRGALGKMIYTPGLQSQVLLNVVKVKANTYLNASQGLKLVNVNEAFQARNSLLTDKITPSISFDSYNQISDFAKNENKF